MIQNLDFTSKEAMMEAVETAVTYIQNKIDKQPELALVLGSGLNGFADTISNPLVIPYEEIPYFPTPTVAGHGGKLVFGEVAGKTIVVMQGRNHYYEGYDTQTITFPIRVFAKLGIKKLILTNACGSANKHLAPGDLMVIEDHLSHFCPSPLRGAYLDEFGPRFTDMSRAYEPEYIELAHSCAKELGIELQQGVYGFWHGPTYETAAEVRAYMALGADVVGMSTVAETIVAVNSGVKVLGISCITNVTCALSGGVTNHEEVMEMGLKVSKKFTALVTSIIERI